MNNGGRGRMWDRYVCGEGTGGMLGLNITDLLSFKSLTDKKLAGKNCFM